MGQTTSQPQQRRDPAERTRTRRSTLLRRGPHPRNQSREDGGNQEDDNTLLSERPAAHRLTRTPAVNRLSQLFRSPHSSSDLGEPSQETGASEQPRAALIQRTRSRFQEMLRMDHSRESTYNLLHRRTSHVQTADDGSLGNDYLPPPRLPSIDISSTFDHDILTTVPPPETSSRSESLPRRSALRLNSLRPDRSFRQLTSSLRRRRSSPPRSSSTRPGGNEDQAAMLSRLLSVAAAATAATLMGDDHNAMSEARSLTGSTGLGDLGGAGEDGSFDGFLRALQNGRIASALRQGGSDGEGDGQGTQSAPLNFFRMFRFGPSSAANQEQRDPVANDAASESGAADGRMVPIIIVGIRSISPNSNSASSTPGEDLPPFIDQLGNFPTPLPADALGAHGHDSIDSILRPPQNGTSFRHRRRASMSNAGLGTPRLGDRMDDQRDHRSPDRRRERPWSVASSGYEPRPPPVTPASPSPELSRISSRNTTPSHSRPASIVASSMREFSSESRRNSMLHRSSAASPLSAHTEETSSIRSTHSSTNLLGDSDGYRMHRRSDTAPNVHYPRFASGHPRRNGVVEPDHLPTLSRSSSRSGTEGSGSEPRTGSDSRSWIIYVLGGSYPENHPILTTPSLFTENPTYEDMMLLSALLGPAKAPVATDEDVENAGGVYNIEVPSMSRDATKTAHLVAVAVEGEDRVELEADQRCLVCLCDFEAEETGRKLVKCNHLFHKDCIDQWLTTGRNSCPLCREQGVDEKKSEEDAEDSEATLDDSDVLPRAGAETVDVDTAIAAS
ncbi:unnamed protein product [Zymoseptoria tritici ST99CH_3D1]|nr:unnamed protein product [Zymoseptoria tritici ST99CH_3D1]